MRMATFMLRRRVPRESENACALELPPPTTGLELKEEIANLTPVRILSRLTLALQRILPLMPSTRMATLMLRRRVPRTDAACPALPRTTPGLEWKGERAGADTRPHPAE